MTYYLTALREKDGVGAEIAPILLWGLSASLGTADLDNDERRISCHHLALIVARYRFFFTRALRALPGYRRGRDVRRQVEPAPRGQEYQALLGARRLVAHCWAVYRTYLALREQAEGHTGVHDEESFQGVRRAEASAKDAEKALLWYELADVLFLGVQQGLMSLTLAKLACEVEEARFWELLESYVLGTVFGEGRSRCRILCLTEALLSEEAADRFFSVGAQLARTVECSFRESTRLETVDVGALGAEIETLGRAWNVGPAPSGMALEALWTTYRQRALFRVERHLEAVIRGLDSPPAEKTPGGGGGLRPGRWAGPNGWADVGGWARVGGFLQTFLDDFEAGRLGWEGLEGQKVSLREAISEVWWAARAAEEYLYWPGDGEDFRSRRQRASAPGDRLYHLLGMAERVDLALELFLETGGEDRGEPPSWNEFLAILEHHEACIFVEEWVSRYGPRLDVIFGKAGGWPIPGGSETSVRQKGGPLSGNGAGQPALPGNRYLYAVDSTVSRLVALARAAGAGPERWGWLFCGHTDRLRELVRRLGPEHGFVCELEALLRAGEVGRAEALIRTTLAPGAEAGDASAHVTVGVHIFHADTRIVRENLLHNKHLFWPVEQLWVLVGSSSANRSIAAHEREICLETGTTHYFISARRHQKAGNQNRVIPNIPAHPEGRTYYLTLDDDYLCGSQALQRLVPLAERHPRAAFVQLPLYLFGGHLLGLSRARRADEAGMVVWGSLTSLGIRDLRLWPEKFANRRPLALPFGTCALLRATPGTNCLEDTSGFFVDSVCEDFAQGLLAFSMKHVHFPRAPVASWDDGILLDEIWIEGDGVDLYGRIRQQTRWCEGSTRNAWTVWLPALRRALAQRSGLAPLTGERPPSWSQLIGGSAIVLGYTLEFLTLLLFVVGFPLTSLMAEPAPTLSHSLVFWGALWCLHMGYGFYLAHHCGLSLKSFLDQHFIRFSAVVGLAEGMYRSFASPHKPWSACKDIRARVPVNLDLVYLGLAGLNLAGLVVGAVRGMTIYYLCLLSVVAALYSFALRHTVPLNVRERVRNLPPVLSVPKMAWRAFRRAGRHEGAVRGESSPIPFVLPVTVAILVATLGATVVRYVGMAPFLPPLVHEHPIFLSWLLTSDLVQLLSVSWIWMFTACGIRNRHIFAYDRLIDAGRDPSEAVWQPERTERWARRLRPLGRFVRYVVGGLEVAGSRGFLTASGAWLLVAVLTLGLRLTHLHQNGAFMDESYYIVAGRKFLEEGTSLPLAWVMFGSYLYPIISALASYLGGLEAARVLSALFAVVTALSIGQTAHRMAGHAVGIVAALCTAVALQSVYIGVLATYDAASVAGVALSLALIASALWKEDQGPRAERRRLALLGLSSLVLLFGILSKYIAIIFVPGLAAAVWFRGLSAPGEERNPLARMAAWLAPLCIGLIVYCLWNWTVLVGWWKFTQSYRTLVTQDAGELARIYVEQGWNVLALMVLAGIGWQWVGRWRSAGESAWSASPCVLWCSRSPSLTRWIQIFLLSQVAVFVVFQVVTRADVNYLKHVNYVFPFLMPVAALGLAHAADVVRDRAQRMGMRRRTGRVLGAAFAAILVILLGLNQVDTLGGIFRWWPDLRPYSAAVQTGLQDGDRVLIDDTGLEYYLLSKAVTVSTPFNIATQGRSGSSAAREGILEGAYDVVLLSGGVTAEGKALHEAVASVIYSAGYSRLFVPPESPPYAGLYVLQAHRARFGRAREAGDAWVEDWYKQTKRRR